MGNGCWRRCKSSLAVEVAVSLVDIIYPLLLLTTAALYGEHYAVAHLLIVIGSSARVFTLAVGLSGDLIFIVPKLLDVARSYTVCTMLSTEYFVR